MAVGFYNVTKVGLYLCFYRTMAIKCYLYFSNGTITIGSAIRNAQKQTGPVNGNECYFWRTTGCTYGDKCRNTHIPAHKGIDRKPWQKDQ